MPEWCHLKSIKIHVRPSQQDERETSPITQTTPEVRLPQRIAKDLKETALNIDYQPLQQALLRLSKHH